MRNKNIFILCLLAGAISGCVSQKNEVQPTVEIKTETVAVVKEEKQPEKKVDITQSDFKRAIQTAVKNMLQSGSLDNPSGDHYIVAVSYIVDMTKKGFDTEDIKQKLRTELAAGRKARVVSFSSKNVVPQIIVAGRVIQRTAYVRNGKKRQEYYLHLVLTEAKSGLKLWENTTPVVRKKTQK